MLHKMAEYANTHVEEIIRQLGEHLTVSLTALLIAAAIGIPFGYLASRSKAADGIVTAFFEMLRVVPSLALLIILIPYVGTGVTPAVMAMAALATPPILVNTIIGFRTTPEMIIEAAKGIGMTDMQILVMIRLPLAKKALIAGIRLAVVSTVGIATIAATINAGGLGVLLLDGLRTMNSAKIFWGSILSAGMAILINIALKKVEDLL